MRRLSRNELRGFVLLFFGLFVTTNILAWWYITEGVMAVDAAQSATQKCQFTLHQIDRNYYLLPKDPEGRINNGK